MAASEAAREGVWLGVLMADLIPGWSEPISITVSVQDSANFWKRSSLFSGGKAGISWA